MKPTEQLLRACSTVRFDANEYQGQACCHLAWQVDSELKLRKEGKDELDCASVCVQTGESPSC